MINQLFSFILGISDSSAVPIYKDVSLRQTLATPLTTSVLKSFSALMLIFAIMFLFVWLMRKFRPMHKFIAGIGGNMGPIKILGRSVLNSKQSIYLVEVPDHLLILGVSGESMNVLSEIRDRAVIETIKREDKRTNFSNYLQGFISKFNLSRATSRESGNSRDIKFNAPTFNGERRLWD